jgi:hypothetical protein
MSFGTVGYSQLWLTKTLIFNYMMYFVALYNRKINNYGNTNNSLQRKN